MGGYLGTTPVVLSTTLADVNGPADISGDLTVDGSITASGGIYLGGTGSDHLLSDYEEGSYTPVVVGGASAVTYVLQNGHYTKVGALVQVSFSLSFSSFTGTSTSLRVSLPFVTSNHVDTYGQQHCLCDNLTTASGALGVQIQPNESRCIFITNSHSTGAHGGLAGSVVTVNSSVRATVVYQTSA